MIGNFGSVASYIYDHVCDDSGVTLARSCEPAKLSILWQIIPLSTHTYPGYQRFFSRAAGIFSVGRRPKSL